MYLCLCKKKIVKYLYLVSMQDYIGSFLHHIKKTKHVSTCVIVRHRILEVPVLRTQQNSLLPVQSFGRSSMGKQGV